MVFKHFSKALLTSFSAKLFLMRKISAPVNVVCHISIPDSIMSTLSAETGPEDANNQSFWMVSERGRKDSDDSDRVVDQKISSASALCMC